MILAFIIFQNRQSQNKITKTETPPIPFPEYVLAGARTKYSFEEIIPLLSTPELVSMFMRNNITYTLEWDKIAGGNEYVPAKTTYERGSGKCVGHAILQCYILEKNGWDAYMIGLSIESRLGHNVCGVNINNKILVLDNEGKIEGYFENISDITKHYSEKGDMTAGGKIRTIKTSEITKTLLNYQVFDLPWTVYE